MTAAAELEPVPSDREAEERDVTAIVRTAVDVVGRTGRVSASAVSSAVEGAARSLARRVVGGAIRDPQRVSSEIELADELAAPPLAPAAVSKATVAMIAARVARRFGPLRTIFRRTPAWLVAAAVPALYASVSHGAYELRLVASHLTLRARAAGIEPDPEHVRRAAIQVLRGEPVDPASEPRHGPLAVRWLRRAGWAALPFTKGVGTRDPDGIAASAASVPPSLLRG